MKTLSSKSIQSSSKSTKSSKAPVCKKAVYYKEYNEPDPKVLHDLTKDYPDLGCIEVEIHPYHNIKKRPYERLLYPDFEWEDKPLPKPVAKRKMSSSSRRGGVEYEVEYYNIMPEQIDKLSEEKKIKKILFIHGAHHSVNLFLKHKDEAQLALYCHPLFSMRNEKEYILRYIDRYKYPFVILTMTSPNLPDLMKSRGVPKAMNDLSPQRWCTREFKLEPSFRFKKMHNLDNTIDLKGIQYHQSPDREGRRGWEDVIKEDPFIYKKVVVKDEDGNPIMIPAKNKHGNPVILKNKKPKMTTKKTLVLKEKGFKYNSLSPDFDDEELDNYKTMAKYQIPINENCRLLDRHGCVFCPFGGTKYYDYIKEHRPVDYKRCKEIVKWGSANRVKKYEYLEKNLSRFSKKDGITRKDMEEIVSLFRRDRDWLNAEVEFKKVLLSQANEDLDKRVEKIERETGKPVTKKRKEEILREEIINFADTEKGRQKVYNYLKQKFEKIDKHSKRGIYIVYPNRPDILT